MIANDIELSGISCISAVAVFLSLVSVPSPNQARWSCTRLRNAPTTLTIAASDVVGGQDAILVLCILEFKSLYHCCNPDHTSVSLLVWSNMV
jgi:hypothetical protein